MNIALILASGTGSRMDQKCAKQFLEINGMPLFLYATKTFQNNELINQIVLVTNEDHIDDVKKICEAANISKLAKVVAGGETRKDSVCNGLKAISAKDNDIIVIHDAARALVTNDIISNNIKACEKYNAVVTAIPATDTEVFGKNNAISSMPNRSELYLEQTPQTFKYKIIKRAHEQNTGNLEVTDDCKLVFQLGIPIHFVEGSRRNFKVTYKEDIEVLSAYLTKD